MSAVQPDAATPAAPPHPTVRLVAGRHKRALYGHPWVYSNEVAMDAAAKALAPGSIVRLVAADGTPLGLAGFNPHPLISARLLTRDTRAEVGHAFLAERLRHALALRQRLYDRPYYRLVHAEADGLPALIIDRFGDTLVVQANGAWVDRQTDALISAAVETLSPAAMVLRNDAPARAQEGLPLEVRVAVGSIDQPILVEENGAVYFADVLAGQKTGWFYDQRDNRAAIAALCRGGRVADVYCYNGGFALACARAGAARVLGIDRSAPALELAARAAAANGVEQSCEFRRAEAFGELERLAAAGERFDVVIADPPAFVKSKKDLQAGARGYRKLTRLAAEVTAPGGFLLIASCSHNVEPALFGEQIARGLADARRSGRLLRFAGAGPDHPVHPFLPETAYLKVAILQVD